MRKHPRWAAWILAAIAAAGFAPLLLGQAAAGSRQEAPMALVGKKLLFRYESGLEVVGRYASADTVEWEALTGPAKGTKGTERTHTREVAPGIFFVSWLESSGTTVSQVIDLDTHRVTAFVTYAAGAERQAMLDHGSITELPG